MKQIRPTFFLQASKSTITKARILRKRMTTEEKILWKHLSQNTLGIRFRRQVPFGPYILDFLCLSKKVAIELDGNQHRMPANKEYDLSRDEYLRSNGMIVMRFSNYEVNHNIEIVLKKIWCEIITQHHH